MDAGTETNAKQSTGTTGGQPHQFTVWDYHRMTEADLFHENPRVELIQGQIIDMAPIGSPHFGMVNRLTRLLVPLVSARGLVSVQNPVRLDPRSEPQPDVAILKPRADDYETGVPGPSDVLLLIEVADTSLDFDRNVKAPLYAQSGIAEYWIVNLPDRIVEVHREPAGARYVQVRRAGPGEPLDILMLPGAALPGADLLHGNAGHGALPY